MERFDIDTKEIQKSLHSFVKTDDFQRELGEKITVS